MEIVLAALVAAGVAVAVVMLVQRPRAVGAAAPVASARQDAGPVPTASTEAREPVPVGRDGLEEELLARRTGRPPFSYAYERCVSARSRTGGATSTTPARS